MWNLLAKLNPFQRTTNVPDETTPETPVTPSKKYQLTRTDAPALLKAWGLGAALAVVTFTGGFLMTSVEWGALAAFAAMAIPPAITAVKRFLSNFQDD
jgi:hypothetical protein